MHLLILTSEHLISKRIALARDVEINAILRLCPNAEVF